MGEGRQKGGRCRCGGAPTCNVTPLKPRPVIVVFKKEETATYWHNDKKGFKSNSHWINADLCRADREAQYFLRERRKRQEQLEERKKKETERSI